MIQQAQQTPLTKKTLRRRRKHKLAGHYEALWRSLRNAGVHQSTGSYSLGVTSCEDGEGVSSVAANIAITAARDMDKPVLLIDCDGSNRAVGKLLKVKQSPGLANLLADEIGAEECLQATSEFNLVALAAGPANQTHHRTTADYERLGSTVEDFKQHFGLIVFDLPNANELSECFTISRMLDGVLLLIESERVRRDVGARAKRQLEEAGANVIGAVLNKA